MPNMMRLALACTLISTAACAGEPTRPASLVRSRTVVGEFVDPNANDDGTCKSGYTVANGRCEPI